MSFFRRQQPMQSPQPQSRPIVKRKFCRHVVKRDEEGRIKEESFPGCSVEEIRQLKRREIEE